MTRTGEQITFRCHTCLYLTRFYARMERHVDAEHWPGGRIEILIPRKPD